MVLMRKSQVLQVIRLVLRGALDLQDRKTLKTLGKILLMGLMRTMVLMVLMVLATELQPSRSGRFAGWSPKVCPNG